MADEIKKPEAPKVSEPKKVEAPKAPKTPAPKAAPAGNKISPASKFNGGKIKPGSPNKPENVPVGVVKKPLETEKGTQKRLNKMFKETGQPTLGIWGRDKKDKLMAPADKVQINPKYDKSEKANQVLADRKKMVEAGLAPKSVNNGIDSYNEETGKFTSSNPIREGGIPGFEDSADLWDKMMSSAQKVVDSGKKLNQNNTSQPPRKQFKDGLLSDYDDDYVEVADSFPSRRRESAEPSWEPGEGWDRDGYETVEDADHPTEITTDDVVEYLRS